MQKSSNQPPTEKKLEADIEAEKAVNEKQLNGIQKNDHDHIM